MPAHHCSVQYLHYQQNKETENHYGDSQQAHDEHKIHVAFIEHPSKVILILFQMHKEHKLTKHMLQAMKQVSVSVNTLRNCLQPS